MGNAGRYGLSVDETQEGKGDTKIRVNAGAPTSGPSGTLAGIAGKGSLIIDTSNGRLYMNTGNKSSPDWKYSNTFST